MAWEITEETYYDEWDRDEDGEAITVPKITVWHIATTGDRDIALATWSGIVAAHSKQLKSGTSYHLYCNSRFMASCGKVR